MKLHTFKTKVISTETVESTRFSLDNSAKVADILMSKLYSHPIKAFVRELGTNAYEAHQLSNIENKPFHIQLPSEKQQYFIIRDFGPGLSDTDIKNIYSFIGKSTKTENNILGGCFGIGSKSVLAYTDQFNVTSYHGGQKSSYVVHRAEDGYINITLLDKVKTEQTGMEISIPINQENIDSEDVLQEVTKLYAWFDTIPLATLDGKQYEIKEHPFESMSYTKCKLYKNLDTASVKMGNIVYPLPNSIIVKYNLKDILLHANIGDLEPVPSRESLRETPNTLKKCDQLVQDLISEINYNLSQEKRSWYEVWYDLNNLPLSTNNLSFKNRQFPKYIDAYVYNIRSPIRSQQRLHRTGHVQFFHLDSKKHWKSKIRKYCFENKIPNAIWCDKKESLKDFLDKFGIDAIIPVSTIPYTPTKKGQQKQVSCKIEKLIRGYGKKNWVKVDTPTHTTVYYVSTTCPIDVWSLYTLANDLHITIYRADNPLPNWINILTEPKKLPSFAKNKNNIVFSATVKRLNNRQQSIIKASIQYGVKLPVKLEKVVDTKPYPTIQHDTTLLSSFEAMFKKYPLLEHFDLNYDNTKTLEKYLEGNLN